MGRTDDVEYPNALRASVDQPSQPMVTVRLAEWIEMAETIKALEAARLQYKASMERFERLGRACLKWLTSGHGYEIDGALAEAIAEWRAGEPKDAKEAT